MRTHLSTETAESRWERKSLCSFGLTEIALPVVAGLLTSAGVGAATAGTIASIATPALLNAGLGAGMSAITGGSPGQGALMGAFGGALGPSLGALGIGGGAAAGAAGDAMASVPYATAGGGMSSGLVDTSLPNIAADGTVGGSAAASGGGGALSKLLGGGQNGGGPLTQSSGSVANSGNKGALSLLAAIIQQNQYHAPTSAPAPNGFNNPLNMNGYINRTPNQNYQPVGGSYYTYGQQAQPQFYSGNQLNLAPGMAHGGALSRAMQCGGMAGGGAFSTGSGEHQVGGDGSGQEDNIPARLSPKEYVMDATTMSRLGDGNPDEGAKKMDQMRHLIANDAGSKQVVQHKTRSPLEYLKKVA